MKTTGRVLLTLTILASIAGGGWWWYKTNQEKNGIHFETAPLERGDITSSISSTGTLEPAVFVNVGSQISGTVKKLLADFNTPVKAGQVVAELDRETLDASVLQAKANVSAARARVSQARSQAALEETRIETDIAQKKASLDKAQANWKRLDSLHEKGYVSAQELDVAKESIALAKAQHDASLGNRVNREVKESEIAAAEASIEQTRAALSQAEANLAHTIIRSPISGIVISRSVDEGQTVAASMQTPTLFTIGDLSRMKVNILVDEADIGQVKAGQDAEFTVDAYPERKFGGKVQEIYRSPTVVQNVVTYNTILMIDNAERLLMPGMTANVSIVTARKESALLAPNSAFRVRMPDAGNEKKNEQPKKRRGKGLWVMDNGKPVMVPVVTGLTNNAHTEIVSVAEGAPREIAEGDMVVVELGGANADNRRRSPLSMGGRH